MRRSMRGAFTITAGKGGRIHLRLVQHRSFVHVRNQASEANSSDTSPLRCVREVVTIIRSRIVAAAAAIMVCSASAPPNGGTISVEPIADNAAPGPVAPEVIEGLGEALGAHGFTMLSDPGHSAYVAHVILSRSVVGTGSVKAPKRPATVAPGLFGAAGGGVTIPLSAGHTRSVALERFRLELLIRNRRSGQLVWRGVALTVRAGSGRDSIGAIASSLSAAVLRSYPNTPAGVVSVR
jgi:hypothetical protein